MRKVICENCGYQLKIDGNFYVCDCCHMRYQRNDANDEPILKRVLKGEKEKKIANLRQNLWQKIHEEYIDSNEILRWAREIRAIVPEDFQACFYELANGSNDKDLIEFINNINTKTYSFYIEDIVKFMCKSLTPKTILPLKNLIERAYESEDKEKYTNYITKVEDEAKKVKSGIYEPSLSRDVFVAYSSFDMKKVLPLVDYLESKNLTCFVAMRNLRHGKGAVANYNMAIKTAIENCKIFLFVSSKNSRTYGCDAFDVEMAYVNHLQTHNGLNKPRIEYLLDDYNKPIDGTDRQIKEFFKDLAFCRSPDDVLGRIAQIKMEAQEQPEKIRKFCTKCGHETDLSTKYCSECGNNAFVSSLDKFNELQLKKQNEEEKKIFEGKVKFCDKCGSKNPEITKFCIDCGNTSFVSSQEEFEELNLIKENKYALIKETPLSSFEYRRNLTGLKITKVKDEYLEEVVIPKSVTGIGDSAFKDFPILKKVTILNDVTEIGAFSFKGCSNLQSVTMDNGVLMIEDSAFSGCRNLKYINIPNSVRMIGDEIFNGCTSLYSISIPDGVTIIGESAFSGCSDLQNISIPNSVTSIGNSAFCNCKSLETISISNNVTSIGFGTFSGCNSLQSIVIPNGVTKINYNAFEDCTSLQSVTIPISVTDIHDDAFQGCSSLNNITRIAHSKLTSNYKCRFNENIIISDGDTEIIPNAFENCIDLKYITIPNSVTKIGENAFNGCTSLLSIDIPDSVTEISENAFNRCTSLQSIDIPDSVTEISENAFNGCTSLQSIDIPNGVAEIRSSAFEGCTYLKSITIPNSVTSILENAFIGCTSLQSITIPDSVNTIGENTFNSCTSLQSITIPDSVTVIGGGTFESCTSLQSITIPDSVTVIGGGAFKSCTSLQSTTIPDSVTVIDSGAFEGCISLQSIIIPNSVTKIGDDAFHGCSSLKSVTYEGTKKQWKQIQIEDSKIKSIFTKKIFLGK